MALAALIFAFWGQPTAAVVIVIAVNQLCDLVQIYSRPGGTTIHQNL